jgi:membrane protein DedA with SNARE-associated domain
VDLESLFSRYGYLALLLGSFADGTPVMLFGGFAAHRGWLVLAPPVILAGACGNFIACASWFFAARALGERILDKRPGWAKPVARMRARVERWEAPSILAVRFLPGLAGAGLVAIALSGVPSGRFLALNAVGALVWAATFGTLGYLLGNTVELLLGEVERYEKPVALALLAATAAWIAYQRWRRWRRPASAPTAAGSPP